MSIFIRIWFGFSLVLLLGGYFIVTTLQQQIKPSIRQVVEDTLADNANMIAALVADDVVSGKVTQSEFDYKVQTALARILDARIWSMHKQRIHQSLYITNAQGIVIYDSEHKAVGQDFSRWNDVYLTLRGQYGARSTRSNIYDENTSTMYVAAPIINQQQLIGVVTLGKTGISVQPYIEKAQHDMLISASIVMIFALLFCGFVAWWLRHSIEKVRQYALTLATNQQDVPYFYSARELNELGQAIYDMRQTIEDHAYIEQYVHTLTHELKSPLTAIQASAEILQDELPLNDQQHFALQIHEQTQRLHMLVERLLLLVKLEKGQEQLNISHVSLDTLIRTILIQRQAVLERRQIHINLDNLSCGTILGDEFWLNQALVNLIDNAIAFTPHHHTIHIELTQQQAQCCVSIMNEGGNIPDYALPHVFERYYSLPRPDTHRKSTGLGLTLVKEVLDQHAAQMTIENVKQGVCVKICFKHSISE